MNAVRELLSASQIFWVAPLFSPFFEKKNYKTQKPPPRHAYTTRCVHSQSVLTYSQTGMFDYLSNTIYALHTNLHPRLIVIQTQWDISKYLKRTMKTHTISHCIELLLKANPES